MEPSVTDISKSVFQSIPLDQIKPSRHQARKQFSEDSIKALAESMKQEGLLQPVSVRQVGDAYELIGGERRLRAAKLLGWTTIDAKLIQTVSEGEAAAKGLIENLQREDLNSIEEAEGFTELKALDSYWNQERIAEISGKSPDYVSRSFSLLELPAEVVEKLRQRNLSREHGIELVRINNANSQKGMANKIVKGGWSVKKTREAIDGLASEKTKAPKELPTDSDGNPTGSFAFKRKNGTILLQARFPGHFGIETMMEDLRAQLTPWLEKNPSPPK